MTLIRGDAPTTAAAIQPIVTELRAKLLQTNGATAHHATTEALATTIHNECATYGAPISVHASRIAAAAAIDLFGVVVAPCDPRPNMARLAEWLGPHDLADGILAARLRTYADLLERRNTRRMKADAGA